MTDVAVMCYTRKVIFITEATTKGSFGGVAGADALCGGDAGKVGEATYKAMVSDNTNRVACTSADCGGGAGEHTDWILQAGETYYRSDAVTPIFTADANGVFSFGSLTNSMFASAGRAVYTGMNADWTSSADNCALWTNQTGSQDGAYGDSSATDSSAIGGVSDRCNQLRHLICVMQ